MFLSESNWSLGLTELINIIAVVFTFLAICTSLYLANKSQSIHYKIIGKKINVNALKKHEYQKLEILNCGSIKFTCSSIGYYIDKNYYFMDFNQSLKKLEYPTKNGKNTSTTETSILPIYVHPGDLLQLCICPADFKFGNINPNKKVQIFLIINGKCKKYHTGCKFKDFQDVTKSFTINSLYFKYSSNNACARNINDDYIR